jgi:hypothetical protein
MGAARALANSQAESVDPVFEQLDGEVDAGIVFAAGAHDAYRSGQPALAEASLADAAEMYGSLLARVPRVALTDAQRLCLQAKLRQLRQLLDQPRPVRTSVPGEAA